MANPHPDKSLDGNNKEGTKETRKSLNDWVKYSSLGMEMAVIVAAFVVGGVMIDKRTAMQFPLFTLVGTALGLTIGMIRLVRAGKML